MTSLIQMAYILIDSRSQCTSPFLEEAMKKSHLFLLVSFLLIFTFPVFSQFQEVSPEELPNLVQSKVRLITDTGSSFQGEILLVDDQFIQLVDLNGQVITILSERVVEVLLIDPNLDKKSYFQDAASNRLIIIPTGFPMETGEFHIADQEIAAVTMSYGVNQHFSLWGGISIPGAIVSARYISSITDDTAISFGTFAGISWIEFTGMLIPYTIFSKGTPENNFTAGGGVLLNFTTTSFDFDAAVLVLGGKWVLSDTTAIVTENWIIWGEMDINNDSITPGWDPIPIVALPAVSFRVAGEKFSWDMGALLPILIQKTNGSYQVEGLGGDWAFIPVPLISLTYRID